MPSSSPHPQDHKDHDLAEIVGGTVGGLVAVGAIAGLLWYGKSHGWWCAGETSTRDLTQLLNVDGE